MSVYRPSKRIRDRWAASTARKQGSKRTEGGRKSVCTSTVLEALGVTRDKYHRSQCLHDMLRILRANGYSVRSRKSAAGKATSVGQLRSVIAAGKICGDQFLVRVEGHVPLLGSDGSTIVDTDPRKRDRRKFTHVYLVESKK